MSCPRPSGSSRPGSWTARRAGAFGALLSLGACGAPTIDKPPAPDMSRLVESYDSPDGSFDPNESTELAVAVTLVDSLLRQTALREQLVDVLDQVLDQAVELSNEGSDSGLTIEADGYMLVTRICAGWGPSAGPDRAANGALLVTATFSDSGLDPIVWGSAQSCRYQVDAAEVELQARSSGNAVSVYWGEAVEQQDLAERALLVALDLDATIDGERLGLSFDFRSLADGTIEYRIPWRGGSLIADVGTGDTVTVRAANGTFTCDTELACRASVSRGAR
jgi:hypothetical protein